MKKRILSIALIYVLIGFLNISAQPKEMYAVLVGMKNYQYPPINPILNGQITSQMIGTRLNLFQNWNSNNINVLNDPTKSQIQGTIQNMPKTSNSINFFYYVGHGTIDGMVMLNTAYQDYNTIPKINPSELQSYFGSFNNYCAFIDACNSGIFAEQMTTGYIGTSSTSSESTWGGSWGSYTPFGGALGNGVSIYTNPIPIGTLTAEGLFAYAEPVARGVSGNHPQYRDNISGNLLITTPAYRACVKIKKQ